MCEDNLMLKGQMKRPKQYFFHKKENEGTIQGEDIILSVFFPIDVKEFLHNLHFALSFSLLHNSGNACSI